MMLDELVARQDIVELVYYGQFDGPPSELVAAIRRAISAFRPIEYQ